MNNTNPKILNPVNPQEAKLHSEPTHKLLDLDGEEPSQLRPQTFE